MKKKQKYIEDVKESLGFMLWQASTKWRRQIEEALSPLDLTHTQFILLASLNHLSYEGHNASQVDLARHANLDVTMTSQILRTLEQKGFIERRMQTGDERSKFPHLTRLGTQLIEQAMAVVEEIDSSFFDHLKSDTKKCRDILQKLHIYES